MTRLEQLAAAGVLAAASILLAALLLLIGLNRTSAQVAELTPFGTLPPTLLTPPPTATPPATATPLSTQTPLPTNTPFVPDYSALRAELDAYVTQQTSKIATLQLGVAFADLQSGDRVSINGQERYYSLSTFKAPLAVYYLWLLEQDQLDEQAADEIHLEPMLGVSSNPATTCIVERVGGLAPFNDWLAEQGLPRESNFVTAWQAWTCPDTGYLPDVDLRYRRGDAAIGLTGDVLLLGCPDASVACDKAFTPDDLAEFHMRLAAGEIINRVSFERWLGWMQKSPEGTFFDDNYSDQVTVYSKNGFRAEDAFIDRNFYHEAGIVRSPRGDYVLIVFMQGNPQWPGGEIIAEIGAIVHAAFLANHPE